MARGIPTIESTVAANPGVRPPEFRSGFSGELTRGFDALGGTLERQAARLQAEQEQRQREKDDLWVTTAVSDANAKWTADLTQRKLTAPDDPTGMTSTLMNDYNKYMDSVLQAAPTPRAKAMLAPRLLALRTGYESDSTIFEANGRVNYRVSQLEQGIDKSAAALQQDPLQYEQIWAQYEDTLDVASATVPLESRDKLRTRMQNLTESAIYGYASKNPRAALKMIDDGKFNGRINPDRLMSLRENIKAKTEEVDAYALYKGNQMLNDALAYLQQNGKLPDGFNPAAAAAMGGGKADNVQTRLAEFNDKAKLNKSVYDMTTQMRDMNPSQRATFIKALDPRGQPMGPNYAEQTALYGQALQYNEALNALVHDDGMALAMLDDSPIGLKARMDKAWANVETQGAKGLDSFREVLGQAILKQKTLGVAEGDLAVLTKVDAQAEVDRLKALPADEVKAQLDAARAQYGEYYPIYLRQMDKLGLNKGYSVAAAMPGSPVATDLINSLKVDQGQMKQFMEGPDASQLETAINSNQTFVNFTKALNTTPGLGQDQAISYRQSIQQLAYYYYSTHKASDVGTAVEMAVNGTIGSQYQPVEINNKATLLPMFMNGVPTTDDARGYIQTGLNELLNNNPLLSQGVKMLGSVGIDLDQFGDPFPGATDHDKEERLFDTIAASGFWVTNKDATGVRLYVQGVDGQAYAIKKKGGGFVEMTFQDAMNLGHNLSTVTEPDPNSIGIPTGN